MANDRSITGNQIRAARALLGLSASDLAAQTGLSRGTIQRAELESADITASNMKRIVETLECLDIVFLSGDVEGVGLRKTAQRTRKRL